jgi:diaminohydroxyphosphoribosylaminopyrimidine deaminase/5-amino-6-(5-phosphoribosylamino)uracil reductase
MVNRTESDERFMRRALALARRGLGRTSPNPMVGAVIVREGKVIAEGYHHAAGRDHAEADALKHAREDVAGATMYVTLEPCSHYGRTPPCADALIAASVGRVVIGMDDPDRQVRGRGIRKLKAAGIAVTVGVLEAACRALNEAYIKHRTTGRPWVTLKFAGSLDGRIATAAGNARWISSPESRKLAHRLRARHDAILAGIGTVLADDPELTVRLVRGRNPLRIVLDAGLRIPPAARVLGEQEKAKTIVVTAAGADAEKAAALKKRGVEVVTVAADGKGRLDLDELLTRLGERDVTSLLVEGGSEVITSFLQRGLADRIIAFIAPKVIGKGTEAVGDLGITEVARAVPLRFERSYRCGPDLVVEAKVEAEGSVPV